jgi:trigger factor
MQVSVEEVSKIVRRLTIIVPANQVEEAYTAQIKQFAKNANIKGFRPGKAPMSFIQERFGNDARKEAFSDVIQKSLYKAITDEKLVPINTPEVEPKMMAPDQPLEFTASFEVMPEIGTVKFSMTNIEKLVVNVTEEDLSYVIDQLVKQYTKWNIVERAAQLKDRVLISYYAIFDGKEELDNKVENYPLELGNKVMLPGFEEGLIGAQAGDERRLNLSFPTDFVPVERAGKPVEFVVQINKVFEAETPVLDAKFIQNLGVKSGTEEDLQQQIRQSLEQERNRLVKEKVKEQVFRELLEQNPLEIPSSLIAREAKNIHDEIYPPHQHHDHHQHSAEETTAFNDVAAKRVALGLLLADYAKQAHIKADKDRVQARILEIASVYESPQEVVAWLSSDERRNGIEGQVMEDQAIDKLLENVPVTEKVMTYAELKGIRK